ncbi:MAG TPA: MaoC family dehydratase [Nocardioidaceae bacterium]|nr:MaoC family dehydratase [Nocardioidaceae bacterium]
MTSAVRVFHGVGEIAAAKGEHIGYSDWHTVTQTEIDTFADATGDHQWIHVDVERAKSSPFGGTVAHGYLTLSLVPSLARQIFMVEDVTMSLNYGVDKVRFPAAVPVGSQLRAGVEVVDVTESPQGVRVGYRFTIEIEGSDKPACVANILVLYIP